MKKIFCHIFLSLLFLGPLYAQEVNIDSLVHRARVTESVERAWNYLQLSLNLRDSYIDSALNYAHQAELILSRDDPENILPFVFKSKGRIYSKKMVYDRSLTYYIKAYDEFFKMDNLQEAGTCAKLIGNVYYELADYSEAYAFYLKSLYAYTKDGDRDGIAWMENNLGTVAHEMGNLEDAEKHYINSYESYMEMGNVVQESRALSNIGLIHLDRQEYDSALHYFAVVIENLKADTSDTETEQYILTGVYNNLALLHMDLDEQDIALDYLRQGLALANNINDPFDIGTVYVNLGSLFGAMGRQDSALFYLHRSLRIAQQGGFRHLELEVFDELAQLHAGIGSYASAYNWLLRYDTVYKAVFNERQSEQIAQLHARYEQELSEREIEQLQSESQTQKMLNKVFFIFFVVIVTLVIIITINLRSRKITNQQLAERNIQISNALEKLSESEKELQKLNQSKDRIFSVVAHDLRNPVAAVTGFSELLYDNFEQFTVETQKEYLLQITQGTQRIQNLLENMLVWARSQMHAVKYEPACLKLKRIVDDSVKELKANLDHKKVTCVLKIDRRHEIFADKAMINTVFRNLIMNAVKFSFPGGKIHINSSLNNGVCQISVSDEGIGIQPEIQEKLFNSNEVVSTPGTTGESGSGLGLVICSEFLERNKGSITVESEPGNGATFVIALPASQEG